MHTCISPSLPLTLSLPPFLSPFSLPLPPPPSPLLLSLSQGGMHSEDLCPVVVGGSVLAGLHRAEVIVKQWGVPIGNQYYRSVMTDFPILLCVNCNKVMIS